MPIVNSGGAHLYAEVVGDVKIGQLGIDIGIDYGEEVYSNEAEDAEVALAAVVVLAVFEDSREVVLIGLHIVARRKEILVARGVGVVVHDVEVGLRIVAVHLVVPVKGIRTPKESTIDDGELPVFMVVDLSTTRKYKGTPGCLTGVGGKGGKALLAELATGGRDCAH